MSPRDRTTEQGMVRPTRQVAIGLGLLLGGAALSAFLIQTGTNAASSIGIVVAIAGVVVLGGAVVNTTRRPVDDSPSDEVDTRAVLALVLALLLPPVGVLVGAGTPARQRRYSGLATVAVAVGAILTVLGTLLLVLASALART